MSSPAVVVKNTTWDLDVPGSSERLINSDPLAYACLPKQDDHEKSDELASTMDGESQSPSSSDDELQSKGQSVLNVAFKRSLQQVIVKNTTFDLDAPVATGRLIFSDPVAYACQQKEDDHEKDDELASMDSTTRSSSSPSDDKLKSEGRNVLKVAFKRCGHALHEALLASTELEWVRGEAQRHKQSCKLETGTMIFVEPGCYDQVVKFARAQQEPLRPFHVIISEQFLPLLAAKILSMPSNLGLRKYKVEPFLKNVGSNQ